MNWTGQTFSILRKCLFLSVNFDLYSEISKLKPPQSILFPLLVPNMEIDDLFKAPMSALYFIFLLFLQLTDTLGTVKYV